MRRIDNHLPLDTGRQKQATAIIGPLLGLVLAFSPIFAGAADNAEPLEKSLRPLMDHAGQVQVTLPEENPEARKAADALFRLYQSEAFQESIRKERQRLAEELFGAGGQEVPVVPPKPPEEGGRVAGERFYLFVSSSVPLATLRNYAADLARLNDPRFVMVLRGFIGGARRIGPTATFIANVLKTDPDCNLDSTRECAMRDIPFIVDPLLFRSSGITHVPAVAFIPEIEKNAQNSRESLSSARTTGEPMIIYGDVSLGHALELMARETGNQELGQIAARIKPIP